MKQVLIDLKINDNLNNKSFIQELMSKVPKEREDLKPKFKNSSPFDSVMADLLFLPNDKGYKYLLTTVDIATHHTDAEALKDKTAKNIIAGFTAIFKRNYMEIPSKLLVDDGSEFNNKKVISYFNKMNTLVRVAASGRSRSQSLIEAYNNFYGSILYMKMNIEEINTGEVSTTWVKWLKDVVKSLNIHMSRNPPNYSEDNTMINSLNSEKLLNIGDEVHVALNKPRDIVTNKRLHGKFRATDLRYTIKPHKIVDYYFSEHQPVMYIVDGFKKNVFTKNELKQIDEASKQRSEREKYTIERIVAKVKQNGRWFYKIKWQGFPTPTLEPVNIIQEDVPQMVRAFEHRNGSNNKRRK